MKSTQCVLATRTYYFKGTGGLIRKFKVKVQTDFLHTLNLKPSLTIFGIECWSECSSSGGNTKGGSAGGSVGGTVGGAPVNKTNRTAVVDTWWEKSWCAVQRMYSVWVESDFLSFQKIISMSHTSEFQSNMKLVSTRYY